MIVGKRHTFPRPIADPAAAKKKPSRPNSVTGHNRPNEWLNPNLKTPDKLTYMVKEKITEEVAGIPLEDDAE